MPPPGSGGSANYLPQVSQTTITFTMSGERVYFGGRLVAQQNGSGAIGAMVTDRLGSTAKYYPYGEQRNNVTQPSVPQLDFATYTRDSATLLDYADQRYYASTFGRFMTSDPYQAGKGSGDPVDPGSWNRYAYVRNDPVNYRDSRGLDIEYAGTGLCSVGTGEGQEFVQCDLYFDTNPGLMQTNLAPPDPDRTPQAVDLTAVADKVLIGQTGIKYHNVGQDAAKLKVIGDRLNDLKNALDGDTDCSAWLTGGSFGGVLNFSTLTVTEAQYFEQDGNSANGIAASTRDIPGWDIIINGQGAFFYGGAVPSASGAFSGILSNSVSGQIFLLIHESAHLTGANGIVQSDADPQVNAANNDEVWKHCHHAISGN